MALGASVYKMIFDTQGLENVTASRREVALQKKIMEETTPVVDKLAQAESVLDRMVGKKLITQEQSNQALSKVKSELTGQAAAVGGVTSAHLSGIPVVGKYISAISDLGSAGGIAAAGIAVLAVAVRNVSDQIGKIDDLLNAAENVGIAADQFQRMSAAAHLADIETAAFSSGIETMMVNISKAAMDPGGKIGKVFKLAELDAKSLKESRPEEAFDKVTSALHKMGNADDRLRSAKGIFGNADFLRIDSSHIELAKDNIQKMGGEIDTIKDDKFKSMDKSLDSLNQNVDLLWKNITFNLSPAIEGWAIRLTKAVQLGETLADSRLFKLLAIQKKVMEDISGITAVNAVVDDVLIGPERKPGAASKPMADVMRDRTGDTADIDDATDSVANLTKELNKQVKELADAAEYAGYAKEEIVLLKLAEQGASAAVRDAAHADASRVLQLKRDTESLKEAQKAKQAIDSFTESLRHQGETAADSARRLADLKLQNDGVDATTRKSLMLRFDESEAQKLVIEVQKKAEAEARKHADAVEGLGDSIQKQEASLLGFNAATGKHEDRLRAAERAALAWQLANDKADETTTKATLGHFDAATALEKRQKATEAAMKAEEDLRKSLRQAGMTDQQKQLDDLKASGVNEEQLKIIETLQKEATLRGLIKSEIQATSGVIKAGSREAADAFSKANQAAVRAAFIRDQKVSGAPVGVAEAPVVSRAQDVVVDKPRRSGSQLRDFVRGDAPSDSAESLRDQRGDIKARSDLQARLAAARSAKDPFADNEARARLSSQGNEKRIADMEAREELMKRLAADKAAKALANVDARDQLANRLNGTTVTPQPKAPTIAGTMIAPQAAEQLKATEKTNTLLGQLVEKTVPLTVEEVTL